MYGSFDLFFADGNTYSYVTYGVFFFSFYFLICLCVSQ